MKKPVQYQQVLLWTMRITATQLLFALMFIGYGHAHESYGQSLLSQKISINANGSEVKKVLNQLEKQVDVRFVFSSKLIQSGRKVNVSVQNKPLYEVLDDILTPLGLQYEISGKIIILKRLESIPEVLPPGKNDGPKKNLSGKVLDETGAGLPGVSVVVKGTQTGTTTNTDGEFKLDIPDNAAPILIFSFVGYTTQEVPVGNQNMLTINMAPEDKSLQEVVVVGYGQVRKTDLTGSVTTIAVDEIKKVAVTSMDQALQGRAAGVQITQNSGAPGGATTIRIRGGNSIQGDNEPLYVIDGIPFKNESSNSGSSFNVLSTLNPSDIESMAILKDASSTAIYGSRGANGVVIITTKRGKSGKSTINLDAYYGVQQVRRKYPVMNAREYAAFVNDANTNEGRNPVYTPQQVEAFGEGTDWQDEIFRSAPMYNYQLSMSGGDEKTQYAISGGYFKQKGIVTNSDFDRYSFRVNLDRKLTNKIKVGNSLTVNRTLSNQSRSDGSLGSAGLVTIAALQFPSILPVYNPDGTYLMNNPALNFTADNPVALAKENKNKNTAYRIFGNVFGEYQIIDGLSLKVVLGIDGIIQKQDSYLPRSVSSGLSQGGVGSINNNQSITWLNENLLTYTKTFNKIHNLTALVGYTQQVNRTENNYAASRNFVNDNLGTGNLGAGSVALVPSSGIGTWGLESYLGRINYGLNDKYLLTASFRADGSSRFGANKRYGFFPSMALAWRASEENFIKHVKSISDLKIRATVGRTGNQDGIGNYPAYSLLSTQNYVLGNVVSTGIGPNQIANPDLSWETTTQSDVGVDLGLFGNRVTVTADAYLKRTKDLLLNVTIPSSSGFSNAIKNLGKVENKGIELSISSHNIDGAFKWNTDFNYAINRNKVLDIGGAPQIFAGDVANIAQNVSSGIIRVGEPLGSFYGYVTDGLYQSADELAALTDASARKPGDRRYKDLNGDKKIDDNDRTIIGRAQPKFIGGISNTFSYKGLDLTVFFQGVYGNKILNANRFELEYLNGTTNQDRDMLNRWTPTNTNTDIPRASTTRPANRISTRQIEDGSYLRLKNIQLAYNLPSSVTKSLHVQGIRFYVTAQNYVTWTKYSGYDPEVNRFGQDSRSQGFDYASYPAAKTLIFGLNVSF
ncbi:TonB-linked outer membrane protein, SusC/RagA family [Dyadobacter koreensis]|uniref:TonB-linked outer membrane protein, SusC/RagA family n=1 Tax=Dyadobacter koreensis TaxID=408657 RepID=A0A1H6ZFH9_9BACT|nr:TonB-dependent receptor [Dyadobacter koreensis]SEJ50237.1 TonB-linked outer membrane protein, SusC/RagA family [Dyadobacter koreensis]